MPRKLTLEE